MNGADIEGEQAQGGEHDADEEEDDDREDSGPRKIESPGVVEHIALDEDEEAEGARQGDDGDTEVAGKFQGKKAVGKD